jgi:phosphoglycerate dehydrogenase-like enzyme
MRIVLCYPVEDRHYQQLCAAAPGEKLFAATQENIADEIFSADLFCGHAKVPMPWPRVVEQGRLKWIQSSAAGLDHCLVPEVVQSDIVVSGASGLFADQVAEQTMALLLGVLRNAPRFFRDQLAREFIRRPTQDLHHKSVGIVGFGGNGRRIAEVLAPFKTRILATDVFPSDKPSHVEQLWPADRLDDLLAAVDIVILCLPLTETTRGMIDARALANMKPGGLLINVGRGPTVIEADLVQALHSGHLGGAGLDVAQVEPLPPDSPLWEMANVMISPHVGAQSARRIDDTTDRICENLRRYLAGKPLIDLTDKRLGFARREPVSAP